MTPFLRPLNAFLIPPAIGALVALCLPQIGTRAAGLLFLLSLAAGAAWGMRRFRNDPDLSRGEEKFRRVFDFCPDYMIVGRLSDGKIVNANSGFEKVTGFRIADAVGKTTLDLGLWCDPVERQTFLKLLREHKCVHEAPTRLQRRDGSIIDVLVSATLFELDEVDYYVSIVRDVTETLTMQRRLSASEARLKAIFEASPAPMVINRLADFRFVNANPAWETLYGKKSGEVTGQRMSEAGFTPSDIPALRAQTAKLIATGRLDGAEIGFTLPTGKHVSIIYSSRVIDLDGEPVMISINTDITRLKETEQRLKTIFDATPIPITISRAKDHTYLQVNGEFAKWANRPIDRIAGYNVSELGFHALQPDAMRQQTRLLMRDGKIDNAQLEFVTPLGHQLSLMYSSRVVELDGEAAIITVASDITQLKEIEAGLRRTEAALQESEARFVALFQSSPLPMAVFNATDGNYLVSELNAAWYATFGYPPEKVIGRNTIDPGFWVNNADREHVLRAAEQEGDVSDFECWVRRADGSRIFCSISCSLIDLGDHSLLIAAYLDITERHRIEEEMRKLNSDLEARMLERTRELQQAQSNLMQSEKLASLGSLVAGVAHEINTPIGNSMAVATTMADQAKGLRQMLASGMRRSALETFIADAESGTEILTRNLQRATELIQSFKSIAVDQASNQRREFDLGQIIDETLIALRPTFKKKPFTVSSEVGGELVMNSYPGPLEQVVVNFINNAILHGFDGRDCGTIRITAQALGEDWISLSVIDDGNGISAANLPRIFDPYFTTKSGAGGCGLGLHIVRQIVERDLGGRIRVISSEGRGTEMRIELPRTAPEKGSKIA